MGAAFVFPPNPAPGDQVVGNNGATYEWRNGRWIGVGGGGIEFPLSVERGGTGAGNAALARSNLNAQATLSFPLTVAQGGTNANTEAGARGSLDAQQRLTFPLTVAQGGTNAGDPAGARAALGLTLPLPLGSGGTGANDAAGARAALGILNMASRTAPIMLAAANGAAVLTGTGPELVRIGNTVFCNYQGANKTTATANTISFAEVPMGYRPTAAVTQAIQTPAINVTVSQPTTGTSVFPDNPGTNVANVATGAPTRWVMRHGTQFGANAAISLSMQWRTADAMP